MTVSIPFSIEQTTSKLFATVICDAAYRFGTLLPIGDGLSIFRAPWQHSLGIVEHRNLTTSIATADGDVFTGRAIWIGHMTE